MWGIRFGGLGDRRERIGRRMEIGAVASAILLAGGPIAGFLAWWWHHPPGAPAPIDPTVLSWAGVTLLVVALVSLLVVGRWFRRLGSNSDIEELRKAAFAYRLGGTLALRPFLTADGQELRPDSRIEAYARGIEEPTFLKNVSLPSFLLAVLLALSLGLLAFSADRLDLAGQPSLILGGPLVARDGVLAGGLDGPDGSLRARLVDYQAGALLCLAFAFLGALLWSITYLSRRMALRDVTGHAYQTIALRLLAAAIVAVFVYHAEALLRVGDGEPGSWDQIVVLLVAFAAGVVPEVALRWMAAQTRRLFGAGAIRRADELELELIEGIDAYTRVRLAEAGIYDAQSLVAANPLHLTLKTPFGLPQVIDWIGQACLLVQLKPDAYRQLREQGLRTAWQLERLAALREEDRSEIAGEPAGSAPLPEGAAPPAAGSEAAGGLPLPPDRARALLVLLEADPAFVRAAEVARCMRAAGARLVVSTN